MQIYRFTAIYFDVVRQSFPLVTGEVHKGKEAEEKDVWPYTGKGSRGLTGREVLLVSREYFSSQYPLASRKLCKHQRMLPFLGMKTRGTFSFIQVPIRVPCLAAKLREDGYRQERLSLKHGEECSHKLCHCVTSRI